LIHFFKRAMELASQLPKYDMETDISQMEAPTFTTIDRSNPAPMLTLDWDHKVNLVGKKVMNPMIHCCDKCFKPILIYGRMIPCKHVFCLGCARQEERTCPRCGDKVNRVEQAGLGNIFLCTQGGSRYGNNGCRRTYLSSRDLSAHITHRHNESKPGKETKEKGLAELSRNPLASISKASLASVVAAVNSANNTYSSTGTYGTNTYSSVGQEGMNISVLGTGRTNTNFITIQPHETAPTSNPQPTTPGFQTYPPAQGSANYSTYSGGAGGSGAPAQGGYPNLSQPPPAYSGQYSGSSGGQYTHTQYTTSVYGASPGAPGGGPAPYTTQSPAPGPYQTTSQPPAGSYQTGGGAPQGGYQQAAWNRPPPQGGQPGTYYRR